VPQVVLAAARHLVDRERHADRATDLLDQRDRVGRDLGADAVAGQHDEAVLVLHSADTLAHTSSSNARDDRASPRAIAHTVSTILRLTGVAPPPRLTTSPLRKSIAGVRPRSIAASIELRIRR
jgi:hypothetical protein